MRVILFQDRFADLVRCGHKRQTIRKTARCKPGEYLSLRRWTGKPYRSKQEHLLTAQCRRVIPVTITEEGIVCQDYLGRFEYDYPKGAMAFKDGFNGWPGMRDWFKNTHGLPFKGWIITW